MESKPCKNGFTLIEVLIGMVIASIVMIAATATFWHIQSTSNTIDQRTNMAMNARGAVYLIEEKIRLMGFNPEGDMRDSEVMDVSDGCCATGAFLTFNRNDLEDPTDNSDDRTISIGLNSGDDNNGGGRDGFADNGATSLVVGPAGGGNAADNVEVLRFAYAFDDDDDGSVDLSSNNNIRWAIDSDGDGELDTELDTDDNGEIDASDTIGGSSMASSVDISKIRAVKIWIVVRSQNPVRGSTTNNTFVVGDQRYTPNDNFVHTMFTTTVMCRNMI